MPAIGSCQVHKTHRPVPLRWVEHHIQPLAMGGMNVPENRVKVCDTGHYNIHRLLDVLLLEDKQNPVETPGELTLARADGGTPHERLLAIKGFDMWVVAGRPGVRVFEDHAWEPHVWGLTTV